MAFKGLPSSIFGIVCIYLFSQAYGQNDEKCAEVHITRCYLNFTRSRLHDAFMFDPRTTAMFSKEKADEVCDAMMPVSPCKHPFMNCPMEASQLASREEAYRAQRDLFCTAAKRDEYAKAYLCIVSNEGFQNCTNSLPGSPPDDSSSASFECAAAELMLSCMEQFRSTCSQLRGTNNLLSVIVNTQALVGCDTSSADTPDHKLVAGSSGVTIRLMTDNPLVSSAGPTTLSDNARASWIVVYAVVVAASGILRN